METLQHEFGNDGVRNIHSQMTSEAHCSRFSGFRTKIYFESIKALTVHASSVLSGQSHSGGLQ